MKIRNILRGIPLLLLIVSGLSVFLSCKGPSDSAATFYTVTFDAQGGSAVLPLKVEQGKTIAKPTDPTKNGFTFGGWYKESAYTTPWNFATDTVTADITLYAKWTPVAPATVTVTFAVKGGHGKLTAKADGKELKSGEQVKKGTDVTFTANPDAGYAVESLSVNGETKSGASVTVKADKDLTAAVKFKAADTVTYTVTFDAQGGSAVAPIKAGQGKTIAQPTDPVKDGFTFGGWYKESTCITPWNFATDTVTADITLYAKWNDVTVTVTLVVKDGNGTLTAKADGKELKSGATVKKGTDVTFTATADSGFEIDYILINEEEKTGTEITVKADKDITATVKFKAQGTSGTKLVTVHYNASPAAGGSISAKDANGTPVSSGNKIEKGTVLEFTATPTTGYDISEWTGDATAEPDNKTAKLTVTQDSTVTVTFTLKKYTVSFDTQGGSAVAPLEAEHGKTITKPAPDPAKTPFAFGGWYKEKECKTLWDFATDTVTADITLYAQWKITIQYDSKKIKCRKNGGPDITPGNVVYENDKLNFEAILPDGRIVDKWSINGTPKDGATEKSFFYTVKASDVKDGSITIDYQDKAATSATIKFDSNKMTCKKKDGTPVTPDETVYEDTWLTFSAKLPEGKIVTKWLVNSSVKTKNSQSFQYTVRIADAQSGSIRVDYEEKEAAKATIQFDSNKMTCTKNLGKTTVTTGSTVYENDKLDFTAAAGKTVDKWIVNGKETEKTGPYFYYRVRETDKDTIITVDYK